MPTPKRPWPEPPEAYGYLELDQRGHWLIRGQPISRPALIEHLQRHYQHDDAGRWFVQNGWQRAFVTLAYTPWVLHVDGSGKLSTHCQQPAGPLSGAFLDESGALILLTTQGPGLLHGNDLGWALDRLSTHGGAITDVDLETALAQASGVTTALHFRQPGGPPLVVQRLDRDQVARHFGFIVAPQRPAQTAPHQGNLH